MSSRGRRPRDLHWSPKVQLAALGMTIFARRGFESLQRILMKLAGLHDHRQVAALVEEELELLQRIAIDHDQVGIGTRLDDAELAFLAQDLRADGRGLADDLQRLQHLAPEDEFAALLDLQWAQQIGAEAHLHARLLADLERAQR